MRLESIEVVPVRLPLPRAFVMTRDWTMDSAYVVLVRVRDTDGATGIGYSVMYNDRFHRAVTTATEALATLLEGAEVRSVEQEWARLHLSLSQTGAEGIGSLALGAIDVALWDLAGKRAGQPVFRLLGAAHEAVKAYASATYFFQLPSEDDYVDVAQQLLERGFTAMKLDFPRPPTHWKVGVERVKRLRETVGDEIGLMIDCIGLWAPAEVIRFGRELESCHLVWIEDPTHEADVAGYEQIAAALDTPVASGEWAFSVRPLHSWAARRTVDVLIGDVLRIGGLTPWKSLASSAAVNRVGLASHLYSEVSQHALAASPTSRLLEWSDWTFALLENPPALTDGAMVMSEAPGLGIDLDEAALQRYRCA